MPMRCAMRSQLGVLGDVDLLAVGQTAFHLLGEHGGSSKPPDQLLAALTALILAALVDEDGASDIAIPSSDNTAAINIG